MWRYTRPSLYHKHGVAYGQWCAPWVVGPHGRPTNQQVAGQLHRPDSSKPHQSHPNGLIERESQLAALHQYAGEASHGQGRLVLVSGEAGVGKSALLEEFAEELADARWLWAGCDGLFTPAALGPLLDIASQLDGELLRLCRAEAKRDQLYGALLRQLSDLETLTVIAIEDIHWADEATLDLLSYLGRRIQHLPVLLLVTYRDDALVSNDPLRLTLGGLASQRATRRLSLPTLSAAGVATLAHGTDRRDRTASADRRQSLLRYRGAASGSDGLPASVRDAVLARTRTLSTPAREALDTAALIGSRMQSELLVSLIDNPLVTDELISHGLLIKDGDDLRFRHEIARVAIEGAIPPYRRAAIHTKIMEALLSSGSDDDARLAFHAEGAGMPSWSSPTRRGRAVVPLHWVHAAKLRLSTSVPCVLCQRPISAHGLSCWITWPSNLTSLIDGRTTWRPAPKPPRCGTNWATSHASLIRY